MRKPNPLYTLFLAFKIFTSAFGEIGGMCVLVGAVVFLGNFIGLWCLVVGSLMFFTGKDLAKTIAREEKESGGGDEGPDLPLRAV